MSISKRYKYKQEELNSSEADRFRINVNEVEVIDLCNKCRNLLHQKLLDPSPGYGKFMELSTKQCIFGAIYVGNVFNCTHFEEK